MVNTICGRPLNFNCPTIATKKRELDLCSVFYSQLNLLWMWIVNPCQNFRTMLSEISQYNVLNVRQCLSRCFCVRVKKLYSCCPPDQSSSASHQQGHRHRSRQGRLPCRRWTGRTPVWLYWHVSLVLASSHVELCHRKYISFIERRQLLRTVHDYMTLFFIQLRSFDPAFSVSILLLLIALFWLIIIVVVRPYVKWWRCLFVCHLHRRFTCRTFWHRAPL